MGQDKTQELLKEKLRGKGLKVTHQRLQVLSVLEENGGRHMTAEDIYELVSVDNPKIGVRYEIGHLLNGDTRHNHHHLICKRCNKVVPFDDDLLDDLEEHIEKATGFHVLDHELKFYGLCSKCQKKENEEK